MQEDRPVPAIQTVQNAHNAINQWLPRRREAIATMEGMANKIKVANGVKLAGCIAGAASGLVAGTLGLVAVFKRGEMPTWLITTGGMTGVVGMGGALASGVADFIKAVIVQKLEREVSNDQTIKNTLDRTLDNDILAIIKEGRHDITLTNYYAEGFLAKVGRSFLTFSLTSLYVAEMASVYTAEIASSAAAEAAAEYIVNITLQYIVTYEDKAHPSHREYENRRKEAINRATSAAKTAVANATVAGKLLKQSTVTNIIRTAGQRAGKMAVRLTDNNAIVTATNQHEVSVFNWNFQAKYKDLVKNLTQKVKTDAAIKARRTGIGLNYITETFAGSIGKAVRYALPILNFGTAAWNIYESYRTIKEFTKEMQKISMLKKEANVYVNVYNDFAGRINEAMRRPASSEVQVLPQTIVLPYPEVC